MPWNTRLKPYTTRKGWGRKIEGRNGKKEKKKKMKIKKETKERKGRIPDQRSKRSEKGKEAILDQWKKEDRNSSKPDCHS